LKLSLVVPAKRGKQYLSGKAMLRDKKEASRTPDGASLGGSACKEPPSSCTLTHTHAAKTQDNILVEGRDRKSGSERVISVGLVHCPSPKPGRCYLQAPSQAVRATIKFKCSSILPQAPAFSFPFMDF
jgi:hypothetical protein